MVRDEQQGAHAPMQEQCSCSRSDSKPAATGAQDSTCEAASGAAAAAAAAATLWVVLGHQDVQCHPQEH